MSTTAGRWTKLYGSLVSGRAYQLSHEAVLLGVRAEVWSDDQETDGFVPKGAAYSVADLDDPQPFVDELVAADRWRSVEGGWQIVGFLDRHETSGEREDARQSEKARAQGWRLHTKGQHTAEGPRSCDACSELRRTSVRTSVRTLVRTRYVRDATRRDSDALDSARSASGEAPLAPETEDFLEQTGQRDPATYEAMRRLMREVGRAK